MSMLPATAMQHLVITAIGDDRPGIVGELTTLLASAGANLIDTRMVNLRGQFAMMVLAECPPEGAAQLESALPGSGRTIGMEVSVKRPGATRPGVDGLRYRLKTYSMDRPGIVARLSTILRGHGVNIEELKAWQESAAFAGGPLFMSEMRLTVPQTTPLRTLRADLEHACNELNCDVDLEPG